jgi:hypothetical protein
MMSTQRQLLVNAACHDGVIGVREVARASDLAVSHRLSRLESFDFHDCSRFL